MNSIYRGALAWRMKRGNYDLTISLSHNRGQDLAICGGTQFGLLRAAARPPSLNDRSEIALEKRCYAESSLIVAHSRMMELELQDLYGVSKEKIRLIHPPVDARQFHPGPPARKDDLKKRFGLSVDRKTLLFPSTSHERKGLPLLLQALALLPPGRFELAVAGDASGLLHGRSAGSAPARSWGNVKASSSIS